MPRGLSLMGQARTLFEFAALASGEYVRAATGQADWVPPEVNSCCKQEVYPCSSPECWSYRHW
jgi:hypothetical protein